jgi:hypothetical protein
VASCVNLDGSGRHRPPPHQHSLIMDHLSDAGGAFPETNAEEHSAVRLRSVRSDMRVLTLELDA